MFVSNYNEMLSTILDGSFEGKVDKKMMKNVSENVFGLFMDYGVMAEMMDDVDFEVSTLEVSAKRKNSDFAVNFKDSKNNSLKQLMEMMNEQYIKSKTKETAADNIEM